MQDILAAIARAAEGCSVITCWPTLHTCTKIQTLRQIYPRSKEHQPDIQVPLLSTILTMQISKTKIRVIMRLKRSFDVLRWLSKHTTDRKYPVVVLQRTTLSF